MAPLLEVYLKSFVPISFFFSFLWSPVKSFANIWTRGYPSTTMYLASFERKFLSCRDSNHGPHPRSKVAYTSSTALSVCRLQWNDWFSALKLDYLLQSIIILKRDFQSKDYWIFVSDKIMRLSNSSKHKLGI